MKYIVAMKKAKDGEFEFIYDIKIGLNEVRYQTFSGKWKTKTINITDIPIDIYNQRERERTFNTPTFIRGF
jgi:hypothetical protein